jgi:hypothetical protein
MSLEPPAFGVSTSPGTGLAVGATGEPVTVPAGSVGDGAFSPPLQAQNRIVTRTSVEKLGRDKLRPFDRVGANATLALAAGSNELKIV